MPLPGRSRQLVAALLPVSFFSLFATMGACGGEIPETPLEPVTIGSGDVKVIASFDPFTLAIVGKDGATVLETYPGQEGAYGDPSATVDAFTVALRLLPGWDGYQANEAPWRHGSVSVEEQSANRAVFTIAGEGIDASLSVEVEGERVHLAYEAHDPADATALNKSSIAFKLRDGEHFFGLGERYTSVDHRGLSLYSYAEEGGLGTGEDAPPGPENPLPNGRSMTYFPVPFFLSSQGYGVHLDTTYRTEVHLGSEQEDGWRAAVNASSYALTVYVDPDPLKTIDAYTTDTGRPPVPAPWVFGPRRRVGSGDQALGKPEYVAMRDEKIPVTGVDDAVHFLPALSQVGREQELMDWTSAAHALGYKVMAYNNPYVAANNDASADDYAFGKANGYFVKGPDGEPAITQFISGQLLEVAAVDLTNPDAAEWFQGLLKRTLDFGYDGWMHDFGEYTARDSTFFDGRRGDEMHNEFPVLSAKAAHDIMEKERPGDYLFFVRSGYAGTQRYVPAVWGGDAEATFDETQGLPSSVRGGLNLSMTGVPYWGSDMTGFKCLTDAPNDKEVFLRWVEFGAVSPIMMEQNACSNPVGEHKTKWKLWNDEETMEHYRKYAGLHTRLEPYFVVLANEASRSGRPLTLHPFLLHPEAEETYAIEDAYYLGPALYVSPVVRRGETEKTTWLPPGATYVHFDDLTVHEGGADGTVDAPLGKLPLFLVSGNLLPLLDPSVQTLAPATDPTVVTADDVADRLDVRVALEPGQSATLTLADGTVLTATRGEGSGNPGALEEVTDATIADCALCFVASDEGDVARLRVNGDEAPSSDVTIEDVHVTSQGGPSRRVRWDVLRID